jgi:multidrug transporter EmrE-like cation transporter
LATVVALVASHRSQRRRALLLVTSCTIIGAFAQLLIKSGANALPGHLGFDIASALAIITNLKVIAGYSLYGINTVLLVLALRHAELSILYPIIALTYVWVSLLSIFVLHEQMNWDRAIGIALIVFGVAVIGRETRS